ncbi:OB-fold nucleic acid binding domain-containing protein [Halorarum salinum]|uniref:Uncharacterized protein n=1 Tax=Halorarum salinum TaxID=2743089 RepID=A0A7D5LB87_9EURY|nr:OB-fold nucleic acid binding domain-containing protein [Halobaculum salinum]QLG61955.1 hypothetical protein HUG12_09580 [Halobaculum salinum]
MTIVAIEESAETAAVSPKEPAPQEVREYILDNTDLTADTLTGARNEVQAEISFLSDVAAYYLIAQRHGLDPAEFFQTKKQAYALKVGNLRPEMRSADLTATVKQITPINEFERDDGSDGKVCNIIVGDQTGKAVVTLWDEDTAYASEFESGDKLRIEDGYTKMASDFCQSRFGCEVELRLGNDGTLLKQTGTGDEWVPVTG